MKCYKVVRKGYKCGGGERMTSSFVSGSAQVEYEIGKLSTPPAWLAENGHGILAYDTLAGAARHTGTNLAVLECAVMGPQRELPEFCYPADLKYKQRSPSHFRRFPEGTVAFDGVIPMRIVPESEVRAALKL